MARSIDYGNLTVDDLHYLGQRSWLVKEAEDLGFEGVRELVLDRANIVEEDLEEEEEPEEEEEDENTSYEELDTAALRDLLKTRELTSSGTKAELIARLVTADQQS